MFSLHNEILKRVVFWSEVLSASITPDNWKHLDRCDVLLVCHDANRGYDYGGQAYAPLLDSLGDSLKQKGLTTQSLAKCFSKLTGTRAHGEPATINRASLYILLRSKIIRLIWGQSKGEKWVEKQHEQLWQSILECCRPQAVICIQPESSLCRIGHAQGVAIYDLQHGTICDGHRLYDKTYKETNETRNLPHGFLCWDSRSAKILLKWAPKRGINVHILGNPWFCRFLQVENNDHLVKESLQIQPLLGHQRSIILLSLQWGMMQFFGNYVPNGVMPEALEQAILKTAKKYCWLIRLHPVQIRGSESSMVKDYLSRTFGHLNTVEWEQCSHIPLPLVLKWSNLHITYSSTTTIEAAWMGLRTGLLNPELQAEGKLNSRYRDERSLGIAEILPLEAGAIEAWIHSILKKEKLQSTLPQSEANLDAFIAEIKAH